MRRNRRILSLSLAIVALNTLSITYAYSRPTDSVPIAGPTSSPGLAGQTAIFARSTTSSSTTSLLVSPLATGYCELIAEYVHLSQSTFNNVAANAVVKCYGTSIRISSIHVTLYKAGVIDHYLTGPYSAGYANTASPFYYSIFKSPCNSSITSTYWSIAYGAGTYPDGAPTQATVVSPRFPLACGTPW